MIIAPRELEIRHFHLFCGLGGGAKGFNRGRAEVGHLRARFRCLGGVDVNAAAIRDFDRLAQANGTVLDLFSREQYVAFHGHEPPSGWREATPEDIRAAAGGERPHIAFGSAPCKGFSGLLSESKSKSDRYAALNQLALRGLWLALEAWKDDPVDLWLWENVPRMATRGRPVLDQMLRLFDAFGYARNETTHDCGELGGLGQSRKRFLVVARHREKVPPFLYEPHKRRMVGVGDIIGKFPAPGPDLVLPMHRLPMLQWQTWVRLAFVEAGKDWRSLNRLRVSDGVLRDYALVPERSWFGSALGVARYDEPAGVVTSESRPQNGKFAVADPRIAGHEKSVQLGVRPWHEPSGVVTGKMFVGGGPHAVADPRYTAFGEHYGKMRVEGFDQPAHTVTGSDRVGSGALSVADPRVAGRTPFNHLYRVVQWSGNGPAVTGANAGTAAAVADPRVGLVRAAGDHYQNAGQAYGVLPWDAQSGGVTSAACHNNGRWSVADPREPATIWPELLPAPTDRLVACIQALDGTYHRPFTTLELAALQSLVDADELIELDGKSDAAWRERIGNAVPPAAAEAIANVMGQTLLLAWSGETFVLSATPIWVKPIAIALAVNSQAVA